jgi:hypothetical protein
VFVSAAGGWSCDVHEEPPWISDTNLAASLRNQDIDAANAEWPNLRPKQASLNALPGCYRNRGFGSDYAILTATLRYPREAGRAES